MHKVMLSIASQPERVLHKTENDIKTIASGAYSTKSVKEKDIAKGCLY